SAPGARRAAWPARRAAILARGKAASRTISASAPSTAPNWARSSGCGAAAVAGSATRSNATLSSSWPMSRRGWGRGGVGARGWRGGGVNGVITANGAVDATATASLRGRGRNIAEHFDFGPARTEWERVHGLAAERLAAWLPSLPVAVRRYAQAEVYRRLHESGL